MKHLTFNNLAKTAFQFAFLFCIQFSHFSFGQEWTNYTVENTTKTLIDNNINCISVDKEGNKWFGTKSGISKFDGVNWTNYTTEKGLINNGITCITTDKEDNMWFGTKSGVSKFDGVNWTNYTAEDGLINNAVTSIATDNEGNLWFGAFDEFTKSGGVSKFDGTNWTNYTHIDGLAYDYVSCITTDKAGNLWFGTRYGVSKFDGINWKTYVGELIDFWITSIALDQEGNIYFGTNNGVSKFDGTNWAGYSTDDGLINNEVLCLTTDQEDNLWIGTYEGVSKFDGMNWMNYTTAEGLIDNEVKCIITDKVNNIWFGVYHGVTKFDGENWVNYRTSGLIGNDVTFITTDDSGVFWFVTNQGVSKFDGMHWTNYTTDEGLVSNWVTCITTDKEDNFWFGTTSGVSKFDGVNWTTYTTNDGLVDNRIICVTIDKTGNLWFGTQSGVSKFDGTTWVNYTKSDGLINDVVWCINIDKLNNIWFGTDSGISKFNGTTWTNYTTDDGLVNNHVHGITINQDGNLWFGAYDWSTKLGGVSQFDGVNWTNYTTDDGLVSNKVNCLTTDQSGNLWFGTDAGVSKFDGTNWTTYTNFNVLGYNWVNFIMIDKDGRKWFGTPFGISKLSDGGAGPVDIFETPKAIVFNDQNGNGIKDSTEKGISGQMIQIDSTFSFSQDNGFVYSELTDGSHTISFKAPENWKLTTDSTFTINVPNNGDTLYFGIKTIENRPDLKVNVASGPTRSNFSANYWVNYKNVGSVTESGTVEVVLDSVVVFESSVPAVTSKDGQKLRFDFTDLGVNEKKQIRITAKMPNVEFLGDTLTTLVSISPIALDIDSLNNRDTLRSVLTGSYDPNDKAVQQGVLEENYVLFGEKLNYTIRFQNTGTDTAFNVNVYDTISSNMDISSFELIGSSHPCQLEVKGTNTMVFHFYDILLPDSTTNELGSHGYVQYSIKPKKGLAESTKVNNTGYIYFDYNPAIVTNTTLNTYVSQIPKTISTEGLSTISANNLFTLYPNPTESNFTVDLGKETRTVNVKITDIQGRLVKQESKENTRFVHLNLSENKGIFFVTVSTEKGEETLKVVVK